MHADRTNRVLLLLLGVLLLVAGAAGLLLGAWNFGGHRVDQVLVDNPVSRFIGAQGSWFWPVAAAVGVVVAGLCVWWLLAILFSTGRVADIRVPAVGSAGRTRLAAGALGEALSQEIGSYRGVHSARVRVEGEPAVPRLIVAVATERDADLGGLGERIRTRALRHAREALDMPRLPVRLDLTITGRTGRRVA